MTAEVLIYNNDAIVVAADSAITVGGKRVWENGNKIFSMGPRHTLGIMYFNNAEVSGIPWESIIKAFRRSQVNMFDTVRDLHKAFFEFLAVYCKKTRTTFEERLLYQAAALFEDQFAMYLDFQDPTGEDEDADPVVTFDKEQFMAHMGAVSELDTADLITKEVEPHTDILDDFFAVKIQSEYPMLSMPEDFSFSAFVLENLKRQMPTDSFTGLVFFGFGEDQAFPEGIVCVVDGVGEEYVRSWAGSQINVNDRSMSPAGVIALAQRDMTRLFMEGILPSNRELVEELVDDFVSEGDRKEFLDNFDLIIDEEVTDPIVEAIDTLPKEELAATAEALVELTSLRRKIDSDVRSVAGPVDVAVVSKGDGFIWFKRKHYFQPEINGDFFRRKQMESK